MKNNVKILLVLITLLIPALSKAVEIIIYKTYEDYQNKNGEHYDKYVATYFAHSTFKYFATIEFSKGGKKKKIKCEDMWGFTYGDQLFRIFKEYDNTLFFPARAVSVGKKICYYENGTLYLEMKIHPTKKKDDSIEGFDCYISKDLQSYLFPYSEVCFPNPTEGKIRLKKIRKSTPELNEYLDCIGDPCLTSFKVSAVQLCAEAFENGK